RTRWWGRFPTSSGRLRKDFQKLGQLSDALDSLRRRARSDEDGPQARSPRAEDVDLVDVADVRARGRRQVQPRGRGLEDAGVGLSEAALRRVHDDLEKRREPGPLQEPAHAAVGIR